MKPQNESFLKNKCPNWMQSQICQIKEVMERQNKTKQIQISFDDDSVPAQNINKEQEHDNSEKKDSNNVMNPDDYFKDIICNAFKINKKDLHEPYFKKFLSQRKHNAGKIMEAKERKELRFCKDLLKMKHKEVALKSAIEKDQGELKMAVQTDVAFRIYRKAYGESEDAALCTTAKRAHTSRNLRRVTFSPTARTIANTPLKRSRFIPAPTSAQKESPTKLDPIKQEQENKRVCVLSSY